MFDMKTTAPPFFRVIISFAVTLCCGAERLHVEYSSLGDSNDCKWSISGSEYTGSQSVTFVGERCRFWIDSKYSEYDFPDGSRKAARNFCRNPSERGSGPWCYPLGGSEPEDCAIRLCSFEKCRQTGSGAEFTGEMHHSTSGSKCLKWSTILKNKRSGNSDLRKFSDEAYPELSRKWARNFCRNPDSDKGGPWCYVQDKTIVRREYCDVPFCDVRDKIVTPSFGNNDDCDTYIKLGPRSFELKLSVRLWDPQAWKRAYVRIAVTSVAFPSTGIGLWTSKLGFEVVFTSFRAFLTGYVGSAYTVPLSAVEWTNVTLRWSAYYIKVYRDGKFFMSTGFPYRAPMAYFSVSGTDVMWDLAGGDLVTSGEVARVMRPLLRSPTGYHVDVWARSRGGACVNLQQTPTVRFPLLKVCFDDLNSTTVYFQKEEKEPLTLVRKEKSLGVLSWWEWRLVAVSIDDGLLTVSRLFSGVSAGRGATTLLRLRTPIVRRLRWFGFSTLRNTVAHWSLSERPKDDDQTRRAMPPECLETKMGDSYKGFQWTTRSGRACHLWTVNKSFSGRFLDGSPEAAINYCRNPTGDPLGPYCLTDKGVREECDVRLCRSPDCRRAGIATDYAGSLAVTRSNRTCRQWTDAATDALRDDSLYPERSIVSAGNYCRDPSKSPSGPWCYTTDPDVSRDLCDVPDCDLSEDCIVVTQGMHDDRDMFILPSWKSQDGQALRVDLKQWDPTFTDGMTFDLKPSTGSSYERLTIGDYGNQKIKFERVDESGKSTFFQETDSPYPILIGKWTSFWLRILKHQLQLGLLETAEPVATFPLSGNASFLDYYAAHGHYIGTSFPCSECHVERTKTPRFGRIMPLTFRGVPPPLRIWLRGSGVANVVVTKLPREETTVGFSIGINSTIIRLLQSAVPFSTVLAGATSSSALILPDRWSEFRFRLEERLLQVERMNEIILEYRPPKPFLVYFFAVAAAQGEILWAANCKPPEFNISSPRDGGWTSWSTWECSVTCGGGRGVRTRSCTAPPPSLTGRVCDGPSLEDGPCNEFSCGVVSPDTLTKLRADLQLRTEALSGGVGEEVKFSCEGHAMNLVRRETPSIIDAIEWTHNALRVTGDSRVHLKKLQIVLTKTLLSDAGVYVCQVEQADQRLALRIFLLSVTSREPTLKMRIGTEKRLWCGALEIGLFFSDLRARWLHNRFVERRDRPLQREEDDYILLTGKEGVDGIWECHVFNVDLNVSWITSWNRVLILPAPSFFSNLLDDRATKWLFGWTKSERGAALFLYALIGGVALTVFTSVIICLLCSVVERSMQKQ